MKAMILTGGSNCAESYFYTDTWEDANNTWTNITSLVTGTPPGLVRAKMVWDAFDHEIVLYGGDDHAGSGTTETWIFKNMTWSESTLSPTPGARTYFQMVYDPQKSAVLLFGGSPTSDSGTCYQDTWVFQGGNWTKLTPLVSPSVRGYGMMADHPPGGYVVLYGGYTNTVWLSDTWTFGADAVVWGNATPPAFDAGLSTNIQVKVVSPLNNLTITYWNLPSGCLSANATTLSCTPSQFGDFDVLASASDGTGDNASTNISLQVREDPTVNSIAFSPTAVDLGYPTNITANVTGGTLPLTFTWTKLPSGCASANSSTLPVLPTRPGSSPSR